MYCTNATGVSLERTHSRVDHLTEWLPVVNRKGSSTRFDVRAIPTESSDRSSFAAAKESPRWRNSDNAATGLREQEGNPSKGYPEAHGELQCLAAVRRNGVRAFAAHVRQRSVNGNLP
jgi:hypothetical protein